MMKRKGKIILVAALVLGLSAGVSSAHAVPGVDEPYDPGNYYSPTSISIPDSAPSPFALKELSQGDVYDYTRHLRSILFGGNFKDIYQTLLGQLLNEIQDMTGMNLASLEHLGSAVGSIFASSKEIGAAAGIPYMESQGMFRQTTVEGKSFDDGEQLRWAGDVYLSGLNAYKASDEDSEKRMTNINEVLENAAKAKGNMEVTQASSQMGGVYNAEIQRRDVLLANYAAVEAAHSRLEVDQQREDIQNVREGLALKVIDRDNLSETDKGIYTAHTPPGYYRF